MHLSQTEKEALKKELAASLSNEPEVIKVVVFGSFVTAVDPNDLDVDLMCYAGTGLDCHLHILPVASTRRRAIQGHHLQPPRSVQKRSKGFSSFLCSLRHLRQQKIPIFGIPHFHIGSHSSQDGVRGQ